MSNWQHISTAPRNATWIEARWPDGKTEHVHWAEDLSGEDQPSFIGWFRAVKNSKGDVSHYAGVSQPAEWRPITKADALLEELG